MLKHYQISVVNGSSEKIDKFFSSGYVPQGRGDLPKYPFSIPFDWSQDPFLDRNWMFQLHGWRMLDSFFNRMMPNDVLFIGQVMTDWWWFYKSNPGATPWYWYDMSTGLRASKIAYLIRWCSRYGETLPLELDVLQGLLDEHVIRLTRQEELNLGNHGLFQLNGLMALLDAFDREEMARPEYDAATEFAVTHMREILHNQLGQEGVHTEDSPDYHFFALSKIGQVLGAPWWQRDEVADIRLIFDKADVAKEWLVTPELCCPPIGDSAEAPKLKRYSRLNEWLHLSSGNSIGAHLDGYGVVRSKPELVSKDAHYLFFQGSFHTSGHKHADCLSFVWQEAGQYLLWDSGKYGYQKDDWRAYFQSTRAHNCLEVDGKDYSRNKKDAYGSAIECVENAGNGWLIAGQVAHSRLGYTHLRIVYYLPGIGVDVLDLAYNYSAAKRQYRLWWQLGPDAEAKLEEGAVQSFSPNGVQLFGSFSSSIGVPVNLELCCGSREPRIAGWVSREYLKCTPANSLSVLWESSDAEIAFASCWRLQGKNGHFPAFVNKGKVIQASEPDLAAAVNKLISRLGWKFTCEAE